MNKLTYIISFIILVIIIGAGISVSQKKQTVCLITGCNNEITKDNPSDLREFDDELRVPVRFMANTKTIKLYFYNLEEDKKIADYIPCSEEAVLPVEREIPATISPIQETIKLLLKGELTATEKEQGFSTEFPLEGFELKSVNLKNGILALEFDDPLSKSSGGSCRVRLLWNQIAKTAKQFSEVKEVKFMPETIFQP